MKNITTIVSFLVAILSSSAFSDHHAPRVSALEMFQCSFADGKDMGDVKKVASEWDSWVDGKFSDAYTAYIMQPVVYNGADFSIDYIWLGVAESHQAMGRIKDQWFAQGAKMQKKFDAVAPCNASSLLTSMELKPYKNLGGPGYLQVNACELNEGVSYADVAAADKKWIGWMTDNDMALGAYRWFTGVGDARASTTDFYNIYIAESLEARGKAHDMMIKGGLQVAQSLYGDLMVCDKPRVWLAQPSGTVNQQ
jgi:hypothetical protein